MALCVGCKTRGWDFCPGCKCADLKRQLEEEKQAWMVANDAKWKQTKRAEKAEAALRELRAGLETIEHARECGCGECTRQRAVP